MKESLWGYWIIVLGLIVITVMMLLQNYTTTNEQDYYLIKEVTEASLVDSMDLAHYRKYGEVRIIKEKFVEDFLRRFSDTVNINKSYNIKFYDIYEAPPKVSVMVTTTTDRYSVYGDSGKLGVVNKLDAVIETVNKDQRKTVDTEESTDSESNQTNADNNTTDEQNSEQSTGTGTNDSSVPSDKVLTDFPKEISGTRYAANDNAKKSGDAIVKKNDTLDDIKCNQVYCTVGKVNGVPVTNLIVNRSSLTDTKAIVKDGTLAGATGFAPIRVATYSTASTSSENGKLETGEAFRIISTSGNFWKILTKSDQEYYVQSKYCAINLPDYIPSIQYNITNASSSIYKSSKKALAGVTGTKLYAAGQVYNKRLGKYEYIVPVMYPFAQKIYKAEAVLKSQGYILKIYDGYRPHSVSTKIYNSLLALYNSDATVKNGIDYSSNNGKKYTWGTAWFLAKGTSAHNTASAIDVSLATTSGGELMMPTAMHELSTAAIKYYSPDVSKTSANYSSGMKSSIGAKALDSAMTNAGLNTLSSEWWHFQDSNTHQTMKGISSTGFDWQPTSIMSE